MSIIKYSLYNNEYFRRIYMILEFILNNNIDHNFIYNQITFPPSFFINLNNYKIIKKMKIIFFFIFLDFNCSYFFITHHKYISTLLMI